MAAKLDYKAIFNQVLVEVKSGSTIDSACKKIGVTRGTLYRILTPIQKKELANAKALNSDFNHVCHGNNIYISLNSLFKTNESDDI